MIIFSINIVFQVTSKSSGGYCMVVTCLEKIEETKEVIRIRQS